MKTHGEDILIGIIEERRARGRLRMDYKNSFIEKIHKVESWVRWNGQGTQNVQHLDHQRQESGKPRLFKGTCLLRLLYKRHCCLL